MLKKIFIKLYQKHEKKFKSIINYNGPIQAPIKKDDIIGKLKLLIKMNL